MLARIALTTAIVVACSNALAATTITQDRDNDIRNPYQRAVTVNCGAKKACSLVYPKVAKNERLLVSYISCLIVDSAFLGVTVKLYAASAPTIYASFYPVGSGDSATSNEYFSVNSVTRLYVEAGDSPAIALNATSSFIGTSTCFISGETVTLP